MASILLVDDDDNLRIVTAELLRAGGYTVDTANDGKTGLVLYKSKMHDLVITDLVMFGMSGLELIEELRHTEPRPRIIAISGGTKCSIPVFLPAAKRLGAERILAKPVLPDVLLQTVDDLLTQPAPAMIHGAVGKGSNPA
jgi:CheY-like chemotaxis protein